MFLVIDTETTGLPWAHPNVRAIQIGAVIADSGGVPFARWSSMKSVQSPIQRLPDRWRSSSATAR